MLYHYLNIITFAEVHSLVNDTNFKLLIFKLIIWNKIQALL